MQEDIDDQKLHCPHEGDFPTLVHLQKGLGESNALALHICVSMVLVINFAMWMILLSKFFKFIPHVQMPHLAYVTSMFTGVSFVLTLMVFLPKSTEFLMASFRVYEAVVIAKFVELNLMWWGGEKQLMNTLGDDKTLRYNLPPLCCCLCCLNNKLITRKRIKIFRLLAAQMKYVGIFCLFLQIVMASVGVHDGHPDWTNPHTYVKALAKISFMFGFWALFVFYMIEHTYKLLDGSKYLGKFTLMKFFFVLFLLQETIVESLTSKGVIECIPFLSGKAQAFIGLASVVAAQALIFGGIQFFYYYRFPKTEMPEKRESMKEMEMLKNEKNV